MEIGGIIFIEEGNTNCIHLYKEGSFWKAYERSAYLFVKHLKNYQTKRRYYKNINQEIISIGFPDVALSGIIKDLKVTLQSDRLITLELKEEIVSSDFLEWKAQTPLLPSLKSKKKKGMDPEDTHFLTVIRSFSVANKTPMECMQFISELQNKLKVACDGSLL
jgi:hypothetical protein